MSRGCVKGENCKKGERAPFLILGFERTTSAHAGARKALPALLSMRVFKRYEEMPLPFLVQLQSEQPWVPTTTLESKSGSVLDLPGSLVEH